MLHRVKGPRRKPDRQVLQGPCLDCVSTNARRQNGSAGTRENRGKNCLIGREFDGDIQISVRDAKRVESLEDGGPRSGAILP